MTWTTARPTQAGWYWWREDDRTIVIEVYAALGSLWVDDSFLDEYGGEWQGPIEPNP